MHTGENALADDWVFAGGALGVQNRRRHVRRCFEATLDTRTFLAECCREDLRVISRRVALVSAAFSWRVFDVEIGQGSREGQRGLV